MQSATTSVGEDALSARLRALRNSPSAGGISTSTPPPPLARQSSRDPPPPPLLPQRRPLLLPCGGDELSAPLLAEDSAVRDLLQELADANLAGEEVGDTDAADDDSEGEQMARLAKEVLSQARDEASMSHRPKRSWPGEIPEPPEGPEVSLEDPAGAALHLKGAKVWTDKSEVLSLPPVPSAPVSLDSVGSEVQAGRGAARISIDFETDISARLAALRGLGSGTDIDSFGLPSAPTFQPGDRPVRRLSRNVGYTDEDQKTWCLVCLDDGSIRCIGCGGDVYCARCWKDMHVGRAAGYDERGHAWVNFRRE